MFLEKCGDFVWDEHVLCDIPRNRCTFSKNIPMNMGSLHQPLDSFLASKVLTIDKLVNITKV